MYKCNNSLVFKPKSSFVFVKIFKFYFSIGILEKIKKIYPIRHNYIQDKPYLKQQNN